LATNIRCPACRQTLSVPHALPLNLRCPRCQTAFRAAADGSTLVTGQAPLPLAPRATLVAPPIARTRARPALGVRLGLLAGVCAGFLLFVLAGAGLLAYCLWEPAATTETADNAGSHGDLSQPPPQPLPLQPVAFVKKSPGKGQGVGTLLPGQPDPDAPAGTTKGVRSAAAQPPQHANQKAVDAAIARGAAWLKSQVDAGGSFKGIYNERVGAKAFVGLTLLSCGVPADDPAVAAIAQRVRAEGEAETATYHLACCIWFLDKLGSAKDKAMIRKMALQLMAGQLASGGWTYGWPALTPQQETELRTALEGNEPSAAARQQWPVLQFSPGQQLPADRADNSNTQFAVLALWTAQKHGAPVARSLAMAEASFRQRQAVDGWWTYREGQTVLKDSMTCAGLVALAAGKGSQANAAGDNKREAAAPVKDEQIDRALSFLGKRLANLKPSPGLIKADAMGDLCFLWCVERVGVLFDLETIGGQDWFAWGSNIILPWQHADGAWDDRHGAVIDTCFALLFLQRVNVAHDLTDVLQGMGGVRDPGGKPGKGPTRPVLTAGSKVIPTILPGASKLRSGYALPAARPRGSGTRRRKRVRQTSHIDK
jgi:hypothetical protein